MEKKFVMTNMTRVDEGQPQQMSLTTGQQADILRKNWQSHDARWQMAVLQEFGWEAGNRLNKDVGNQMGKVAMHRLMKRLGVTGVNNLHELRHICEVAMNLFFPPPDFEFYFDEKSDSKMVGTIRRCTSYDNVKRVGVEKFYECGCFAMRAGWYEVLGVNVEETLGKCLKAGDDQCEITLCLKGCEDPQKQVGISPEEG